MTISKNLKQYHTFAVDTVCKDIVPLFSELDVYKALVYHKGPFKILGGGSNVLPVKPVEEIILLNAIKGISVIDEDEHTALVAVGAGENWHQLVMWALSHDLGGLENLSYIPGKVGAAPMQNIGAYGVEQEMCFHSLKAIDLHEGTSKVFFKEDCQFGYRESIFKNEFKGKYIITQVNYLLTKEHKLHLEYGGVKDKLSEMGVTNPTIQCISEAIVENGSTKK